MEIKYKYKSVLLIDDEPLDTFVSKSTIAAHCFSKETYIQSTSEAALKFLKQISEIKVILFPEVIFVDINMPVIDGYQFIVNLKKDLKKEMEKFKPKLVMLTSSIYDSDRQKAREHFEEIIFIIKPLTPEILKSI